MWWRQQVKCQRVAAIRLPLYSRRYTQRRRAQRRRPLPRPSSPPAASQSSAAAAPLSRSRGIDPSGPCLVWPLSSVCNSSLLGWSIPSWKSVFSLSQSNPQNPSSFWFGLSWLVCCMVRCSSIHKRVVRLFLSFLSARDQDELTPEELMWCLIMGKALSVVHVKFAPASGEGFRWALGRHLSWYCFWMLSCLLKF